MVSTVVLKVYMNEAAYVNNKCCFERDLHLDNSIMFPFNKCTEIMKLLYGDQAVVSVCQK